MRDPSLNLQAVLKAKHQSLTTARQTVFMALQNHEPQTMHELVSKCLPGIDRASVYRTIALFERLGIVQRLQIGWKYKLELSNTFQEHHHHLTCSRCNQIIPLQEDPNLEKRLIELAKAHNFAAQDHQLEIRGFCQACQKGN
jgi:Fur family ferric uptake transcriptional regulator